MDVPIDLPVFVECCVLNNYVVPYRRMNVPTFHRGLEYIFKERWLPCEGDFMIKLSDGVFEMLVPNRIVSDRVIDHNLLSQFINCFEMDGTLKRFFEGFSCRYLVSLKSGDKFEKIAPRGGGTFEVLFKPGVILGEGGFEQRETDAPKERRKKKGKKEEEEEVREFVPVTSEDIKELWASLNLEERQEKERKLQRRQRKEAREEEAVLASLRKEKKLDTLSLEVSRKAKELSEAATLEPGAVLSGSGLSSSVLSASSLSGSGLSGSTALFESGKYSKSGTYFPKKVERTKMFLQSMDIHESSILEGLKLAGIKNYAIPMIRYSISNCDPDMYYLLDDFSFLDFLWFDHIILAKFVHKILLNLNAIHSFGIVHNQLNNIRNYGIPPVDAGSEPEFIIWNFQNSKSIANESNQRARQSLQKDYFDFYQLLDDSYIYHNNADHPALERRPVFAFERISILEEWKRHELATSAIEHLFDIESKERKEYEEANFAYQSSRKAEDVTPEAKKIQEILFLKEQIKELERQKQLPSSRFLVLKHQKKAKPDAIQRDLMEISEDIESKIERCKYDLQNLLKRQKTSQESFIESRIKRIRAAMGKPSYDYAVDIYRKGAIIFPLGEKIFDALEFYKIALGRIISSGIVTGDVFVGSDIVVTYSKNFFHVPVLMFEGMESFVTSFCPLEYHVNLQNNVYAFADMNYIIFQNAQYRISVKNIKPIEFLTDLEIEIDAAKVHFLLYFWYTSGYSYGSDAYFYDLSIRELKCASLFSLRKIVSGSHRKDLNLIASLSRFQFYSTNEVFRKSLRSRLDSNHKGYLEEILKCLYTLKSNIPELLTNIFTVPKPILYYDEPAPLLAIDRAVLLEMEETNPFDETKGTF